MDCKELFEIIIRSKKYYTSKELLYGTNPGFFLSPYEYNEYLKYKDSQGSDTLKYLHKLELASFNGTSFYFVNCFELLQLSTIYFKSILDDNDNNDKNLSLRNFDEMALSRIYSEVEGTLNIESVPTTRKAVVELANGKRDPKSLNDQIIKNMINGIEFVNKCPEFNEHNLFELYSLLSNGCLDDDHKLKDNEFYRYDTVEIGNYKGCPVSKIKECMDSLFKFVENNKKNFDVVMYLPHIAHYYILYVHPYFDYNGRTARMVSYWISLLINKKAFPPIVSEAINQTKNKYYAALSETRDAHNDLTYFFIYLFNISISYFLTYKNIEEIEQALLNKSIVLTSAEKAYLKKILICNAGKFTHKDFTKWADLDISKQGALKILNKLCEYGLLLSETAKSNIKLFEVNPKIIKYKAPNK